jgi:hypothetical protein
LESGAAHESEEIIELGEGQFDNSVENEGEDIKS